MLINPYVFGDPDVATYIAAVEAADGQALETNVVNAIVNFIVGCKTDGIWNAIKASCVLAGARTLNGALVPLVGPAPTNNNFVSGDYNRKTGLVGNRSSKWLNSNRASTADGRDDMHYSIYLSTAGSASTTRSHFGNTFVNGTTDLSDITALADGRLLIRNRNPGGNAGVGGNFFDAPAGNTTGFMGSSRNSGTTYSIRLSSSTLNVTLGPVAPSFPVSTLNANYEIFRAVLATVEYSDARIAFYSIGSSLNLALLDSRVNTLITALAAAIP